MKLFLLFLHSYNLYLQIVILLLSADCLIGTKANLISSYLQFYILYLGQ